jgi:midasin (ATPase involved in ribosome maturation)
MEKLQFYSSRVPYLPRLKQIAIKELSDYKVSLTGQNALYLYRLLVSSSDFYFLYSVDMLRFMNSLDEMSVYYLCKCTALVFGMSDAQQEILLKKHLNAKQLEFVYEQAFKDYYEHQASYELMLNESVATTTTNSYTAGFVETLELKKVLEDIKMGVSCHLPVLLQGPQGIGKTSLVEQVAHQNQVQGI